MTAFALGFSLTVTTAYADTTIDSNHVQVEAGDTLSGIADKYGTKVKDLVRKNHITNKHLIHVGDKLVIKPKTDKQQTQKVEQSATSTPATISDNTSTVVGSTNSAKEWIASHESGGSYTATNGKYIGRYQLDASYLNGDYSAANQERVADQYVASRYGSWSGAQSFWQSHGWY